jgi:putative CocE/NonD family hydrolase
MTSAAERLAAAGTAALVDASPPLTRAVDVEHDIRLPSAGKVELLTDLYWPKGLGPLPTILVRTPYGRRGGLAGFTPVWARLFAERGYRVVVQSTRGTFGSGSRMDFLSEAEDGRAAADWIVSQPWSNGEIGTYGPSYLSSVQWALASTRPPQLKAMAIQIMAADSRRAMYPGGSFALDTALTWSHLLANQELPGLAALRAIRDQRRQLAPAFRHLPLGRADEVAVGAAVPFYRDWLRHDESDEAFWGPLDFSQAIPGLRVPVSMVGGWYDYYLPYMLEDYRKLVDSGADAQLTIGRWPHTSVAGATAGLRIALAWFDVHLRGQRQRRRPAPVRIEVMGGGGWRDLDSWPPPSRTERWYLQAGGRLTRRPPAPSPPDRYRYDPADPTPAVGGTSLSTEAGPRDNRKLEKRADVLTFTSDRFAEDVELIGPVSAELYVGSSLEHTDFFARLCDVHPDGRSVNVSDGLLRVRPSAPPREADGSFCVEVEMWPTAYRFRRRHRLRLQVSSGAHPRYARNLGTGEPLESATAVKVAEQRVYHDPDHPSALLIPSRPAGV